MAMDAFECLFCRKSFAADVFSPLCPVCGEPLFVAPSRGRRRIRKDRALALEEFADFLPSARVDPVLSLGEGRTPLIPLARLGAGLKRPPVFAKNEAQNPTGSFKDRGTAVAIQKAAADGIRKIGTVSTGNMAASTAAYGARAGMKTFVLLKEGASRASLAAAGVHGAILVSVHGDYGRLYFESLRIGRELGIYFMNSLDPYRNEGYKITAFEMFLQLGRRVPRHVFVPLSSGGHLLGLMRAFADLQNAGLASSYPTFVGVQADGCAPLARAFEAGKERYERLENASTIAHAISNPAPPGGNAVLRMIRDRNGILLSVSDHEMLEAQRRLASFEGLFCQPESATTLAAWVRMGDEGRLAGDGEAVLVLTGSGLKAPEALDELPPPVHEIGLKELEGGLDRLA
jgi:threonine synthase